MTILEGNTSMLSIPGGMLLDKAKDNNKYSTKKEQINCGILCNKYDVTQTN